MKVGPKSSLGPFLHRALQLFPEVEVNRRIYILHSLGAAM